VSAEVRLCTGASIKMKTQIGAGRKPHLTAEAVLRYHAQAMPVRPQSVWCAETSATIWTLVLFSSCVHSL